MPLAQAETVGRVVDAAAKSAGEYGLIGIMFVLVVVGIGIFVWSAFRFAAPHVATLVASTASLHESLKETNLRLSVTLDSIKQDHGDKLSDIKQIVTQNQRAIHAHTAAHGQPPPNLPLAQTIGGV